MASSAASFPVVTSQSLKRTELRKEIQLAPALLQSYDGVYQAPAPGGMVSIGLKGNDLYLKSTSVPQGLQLHAEEQHTFFVKEADLLVSFQSNPQGKTTGLLIKFGGTGTLAPRIEPSH